MDDQQKDARILTAAAVVCFTIGTALWGATLFMDVARMEYYAPGQFVAGFVLLWLANRRSKQTPPPTP